MNINNIIVIIVVNILIKRIWFILLLNLSIVVVIIGIINCIIDCRLLFILLKCIKCFFGISWGIIVFIVGVCILFFSECIIDIIDMVINLFVVLFDDIINRIRINVDIVIVEFDIIMSIFWL